MTVVIGLLPRTYLTRLPGKTRTKHIHSGQSGFRSLHSALTALLETNDSWCLNIDRDLLNGVIFIDLKKAFDTTDHEIILKNLPSMSLIKTP